jgi:hypothetical protein
VIRRRILDLAVEIRVEDPAVERSLSRLLHAFPQSPATENALRYDILPAGDRYTVAVGSQCSQPIDADQIFVKDIRLRVM